MKVAALFLEPYPKTRLARTLALHGVLRKACFAQLEGERTARRAVPTFIEFAVGRTGRARRNT